MLSKLSLLAATASAVYTGFNYGSTNTDGSAVTEEQFTNLFNTAKGLAGTNGEFTAARLYTGIQAGTTNGVISAIPAAINTNTHLLLGMWASAGQADFDNEIAALNAAISQYGSAFTDLIAAISVGSEDLYRISPTGIENMSGAGAEPATLVSYINQVRSALSAANVQAQITHVDTWTAWVNGSNDAVIEAVDFLSMDAYPYFQTTVNNGIDVGNSTFYEALDNTIGAAQGKPVWITETGWPVSGPTENLAVANIANAKTYWDQVKCSAQGVYNLFWYTLQDSYPNTPSPSFGIVPSDLSAGPLFDLTCPASSSSSSTTSTSATSTPSSTATTAVFTPTSASLSSTASSIFGTSQSSIPVSSAPASSAPASSTPASSAPASSAPASSAPASSAPASSAPASSAPASSAPASSAPASSVPASSAAPTTFSTVKSASTTATTAPVPTASGSATGTPVSASASAAPAPSAGSCTTDILSGSYEVRIHCDLLTFHMLIVHTVPSLDRPC